MKILIITYDIYPHIGGKSTHIQNLFNALKEMNIESDVINYSDIGIFWQFIVLKPIYALKRIKILKSISYILSNIITMSLFRSIVKKNISKEEINLIIAQDIFSSKITNNILARLNLHIPIICTVHGDRTNETLSAEIISKNSIAEKYLMEIERDGYLAANQIVSVDNRLKQHVTDFLKEKTKPITVIPNSINVNEYRKSTSQEAENARKRLLPEYLQSCKIILCPRRLTAKNGVVFAAEMFIELHKRNLSDNFALFFAGDGEQRKDIESLIKQFGLNRKIKLLGDVPHEQIREYYWASDIVLVPSVPSHGVIEATSLTALEAMGCGVPVIASNIGGLAELITNNVNGILVPPGNPIAMADAVLDLSKSIELVKSIAENAIKHVSSKHSHIAGAKLFLDLI